MAQQSAHLAFVSQRGRGAGIVEMYFRAHHLTPGLVLRLVHKQVNQGVSNALN